MRADELILKRIVIPKGRDFDPATVETLMASMAQVGLITPICVRRPEAMLPPELVAGRNRLEAARRLGWETIRVIDLYDPEHPKDRFSAPMAEIAENLHRRELGEIERAELMARWVEITAAKQEADAKEAAVKAQAKDKPAQDAQVSSRGGRGKKGGISQAARELGVPRDQVARAVKIAALAPEAKRLAKRLKAPQAVLLEAAKHDVADDQVAVIRGRDARLDVNALSKAMATIGEKARAQGVAQATQTKKKNDDARTLRVINHHVAATKFVSGLSADQRDDLAGLLREIEPFNVAAALAAALEDDGAA